MRLATENWGLPTLSQGAVNASKNALFSVAAWTERAVPNFSPDARACGAAPCAAIDLPSVVWGGLSSRQPSFETALDERPSYFREPRLSNPDRKGGAAHA